MNDHTAYQVGNYRLVNPAVFAQNREGKPEKDTLDFLVETTERIHSDMRDIHRYSGIQVFFNDRERDMVDERIDVRSEAGQAIIRLKQSLKTASFDSTEVFKETVESVRDEYNMIARGNRQLPTYELPPEEENPLRYTYGKCGSSVDNLMTIMREKGITEYDVYVAMSTKGPDTLTPAHRVAVLAFDDFSVSVSYSDQQFGMIYGPLTFLEIDSTDKDDILDALEEFYGGTGWSINRRIIGERDK